MSQEVGIRELKAKLSYYLRRVREGEQVIVTDRGEPVAIINPAPRDANLDPVAAALWKLVAEGKANWSGGKPKGSDQPVTLKGGPSMAQTIIEDREDRV